MKNLQDFEVQAVSGGFIVEAAAVAYLSSALATSGANLASAIAPLHIVQFLGNTIADIAPLASVAAYGTWHFASQETKDEMRESFIQAYSPFVS